jgi:hypothetical protein
VNLNFEVILATELQIGNMSYHTIDPELNEVGDHYELTGTDQIFIMDDIYGWDDDDDMEDDDDIDLDIPPAISEDSHYGILVNGGWTIWFKPDEKVVRLGNYGELIRIIDMVKLGNPKMDLGPNDIITEIEYLKETGHLKERDLLDELDNFDKKDENTKDEDELPF